MKKLIKLLGIKTNYRIQTVKVGHKERFRIQLVAMGYVIETVMNPLIVSPVSPFEFKILSQAEKKLSELKSSM